MEKNDALLAALLAFLSVLLTNFFSNLIARNYAGMDPILVSALGAAATAFVIYYLFRRRKSTS